MRVLVVLCVFALAPGLGQQSLSLDHLLELHRSDPSNANICQQIGVAYIQLEQLDKAEPFFREALRLDPQFTAARKNLATVLWFLDRKAESEREFQAVTKVSPADPVPHLYLGLVAHSRREYAAAKIQFEMAGELATENPEVLPAVLDCYIATSGLEKARRTLDKLEALHQDTANEWQTLADAYDRSGKPEDAYRAYSRAIERDANSESTYIAFADFASAHGNDDYGLQVVGKGLEHLPKSAVLLFEQGLLLALKGDRKRAESSFQQAGNLKPDWVLPLMALGVSKLESGDAAGAAAVFQNARTIDPGDYRAHLLYATALSRTSTLSAENREPAVEALHRALSLNPKDARSYVLLGQLDPEHSESDWQAALKIDPANPTALYQLGLLYQKQGKAAESKRLLEKFRVVKAKMHSEEETIVQILRVNQRPAVASDSSTPVR
jgi:tetratricopeptide (TPR) repeat protein